MNADEFISLVESRLNELILSTNSPISEAMLYAVNGGGKRVRPRALFLALKSLDSADSQRVAQAAELASAIELIHSYSLVHDDLPAMDNDDMRRGKPSVHKAFGEAVGILAGDALLTLAAQTLVRGCAEYGKDFALASAALTDGAQDMVSGQALDLAGTSDEGELVKMYSKKTGALFCSAISAGAIIGDADNNQLEALSSYAAALGLAFQIADDLLDAGESGGLVSLIGIEAAEAKRSLLTAEAVSAAESLPNPDKLKSFALELAGRKS